MNIRKDLYRRKDLLSRATVYFKIGLYKCLKKFAALRNSSLSSHDFRNNFKFIQKVCKSNEELVEKKLYKPFY